MQPSPRSSCSTFHFFRETDPSCSFAVHPRPHSQPQATTDVLSESIGLSFLDRPYKWSHTVCGVLHLATFTYCNVRCIPNMCIGICSFLLLNSISLYEWTSVLICSSINGQLGCFHFLSIMNNNMNICIYFIYLGLRGVELLDHLVTMVNLLRNY